MTSLLSQDDYEALVECIEDALDLPSDSGDRLVQIGYIITLVSTQMLYQ